MSLQRTPVETSCEVDDSADSGSTAQPARHSPATNTIPIILIALLLVSRIGPSGPRRTGGQPLPTLARPDERSEPRTVPDVREANMTQVSADARRHCAMIGQVRHAVPPLASRTTIARVPVCGSV